MHYLKEITITCFSMHLLLHTFAPTYITRMKRNIYTILALCLSVHSAVAQIETVPSTYATSSSATFTGPLANTARTLQWLINDTMLTNLNGFTLTGIHYRQPGSASASWPTTVTTYTSYDIYMGTSVHPSQRSLTNPANNVVGTLIQVRSGSLTIPVGAYTSGSTPNAFGPSITFNTPYEYNGGHLLVELRHAGSTGGGSKSADAVGTSAAGYGTMFSGAWASGYTGVTTMNGANFTMLGFDYSNPLPVSLISFHASQNGADALIQWKTSSAYNVSHFELERSTDGKTFSQIDRIAGIENTMFEKQYAITDKTISKLGKTAVYYRLKTVDVNGSFKYSDIATLLLKQSAVVGVTVSPNPVKDKAAININATQDDKISYTIIDASGKSLNGGLYFISAGANAIPLDIATLPTGMYTVSVKCNTGIYSARFVKQ